MEPNQGPKSAERSSFDNNVSEKARPNAKAATGSQKSYAGPTREETRVSQAYVASLESGERKNPSVATLERLAKALGVPVTELLG